MRIERQAPRATRRLTASLVGAALVLIAGLAGCTRKPPQFVPPGADSAATAAADSFAAMVGDIRDQWESQGGAPTAGVTARRLLDDLRRHPDGALAERARTFLDSCGFSAEVAGAGDVAAVNFFARSDPGGGAWPYLFWRVESSVLQQSLEASGMRLLDLATRGDLSQSAGDEGAEPPQVAAIFGRTSPRGQQPAVIVWRRAPRTATWSLSQTLGRDSLGGVGAAEFIARADGAPGLEARTFRPAPGFDECATCPHINRTLRFDWQPGGFRKISEEVAPSPYYSFVQMIAALSVGDRELAQRFVADPSLLETAQSYGWGQGKSLWRAAPGSEASFEEMTFFRGTREAYKVRFAQRGGQWVITDLQSTQRTVE
jgi:predicted small lipoprotein YifL